ncbi:MAG: folylpolyglutamate synthase/dihydrofolate synthase family protein [Pseudomonadota bacterium]
MSSPGSDVILERMMELHPKIIDLTLDRVYRLLDALGHPERHLPPVIHIAGTNGKGSTQAMIRAGLEAQGKSVHAYISPHLARFHERITLAGSLISEPDLSTVLEECEDANGGAPITYFEITTVAALLAFSRNRADYCLLEVGLGGRLDATNVIDTPALCVITAISIDHQQFLGDTLEKIAFEKAGILKPHVPCVVGRQDGAAFEVIEDQAERKQAPLIAYGQTWHVAQERDRIVFQDDRGLLDLPRPALPGAHQIQNAGNALAALRYLGAPERSCEAAMRGVVWAARMQRLTWGPLVEQSKGAELWLDGGHNPAAGSALAETLHDLPDRATYLICGMLNTKDVSGYLRPLNSVINRLYTVTIPGETATLTAEQTASIGLDLGIDSLPSPSIESAISEITNEEPYARILICGSLYLAGSVLRENG